MALLAFVDMGDEPQTNSLYVMTTKFLTESSSVRYALPLDIRGSEISKLPRRSLEATKWAWRSSITSQTVSEWVGSAKRTKRSCKIAKQKSVLSYPILNKSVHGLIFHFPDSSLGSWNTLEIGICDLFPLISPYIQKHDKWTEMPGLSLTILYALSTLSKRHRHFLWETTDMEYMYRVVQTSWCQVARKVQPVYSQPRPACQAGA